MVFKQTELDEIHAIQLEMLIELDRICRRHGIKYIISGGTLLGAVRNGKFIPWDDDIDVRMDRAEYIKFAQACERELDGNKYFFQDHNTDSDYPWYYGKLRYIHSCYTRSGQEHLKMKNGIFIDVMPADGLPNTAWKRNIIIKIVFLLKKFLYAEVGRMAEPNVLKRCVYGLMNIVPKNYIFDALDNISGHYMDFKYENVTSYSFVKCGQKEYTKRKWHYDSIEISFEEVKVLAPRAYHEWLIMTYGEDYMMPPPKEERVGHNEISKLCIEEVEYESDFISSRKRDENIKND